jgi:hypothetical protein
MEHKIFIHPRWYYQAGDIVDTTVASYNKYTRPFKLYVDEMWDGLCVRDANYSIMWTRVQNSSGSITYNGSCFFKVKKIVNIPKDVA